MTGKACLTQDGHDTIWMPLVLSWRALSISKPTLISSTGSAVRDTLIVSPIPF